MVPYKYCCQRSKLEPNQYYGSNSESDFAAGEPPVAQHALCTPRKAHPSTDKPARLLSTVTRIAGTFVRL